LAKKNQIAVFKKHIEIDITAKLECTHCGEKISTNTGTGDACLRETEQVVNELTEEMYKEGWRQITTKTYGFVGIVCSDCRKGCNEMDNNRPDFKICDRII